MLQHLVHRPFLYVLLWACFLGLPAGAQQSVDLNIEDARVIGLKSIQSGKPEIARAIAKGLLQRDPEDVQAILLLAAAQVALGDGKKGIENAKHALALAANAQDRFSAARIISAAHLRSKRYLKAEIWLRQALQYAPDNRMKSIAARDFRLVRRENPLRISLSFSLKPQSNINNGSRNSSTWLFGLPFVLNPTARALSGTEFDAGVKLRYRFQETPTTATDFGLEVFSQTYTLSPTSRSLAPTANAKDYAFASLEASLTKKILSNNNRTRRDFKASVGQTWYGGKGLKQYLELEFGQENAVSARTSVTFGGTAQMSHKIGGGIPPLYTFGANAAVIFQRDAGQKTELGINLWHATGQSPSSEFTSVALGLNHKFPISRLGADVSLNFGISHRNHPFSTFTTNGRQDTTLSAGVSIGFQNADIYGFSPVLSLNARDTNSNIGLFDSRSFAVGLGIQSSF